MFNLRALKGLASLNLREALYRRVVTPEIEAILDKIPKRVGSFGYDPWGYNENAAHFGLGLFKWLYDHYFRVTAHGLENIPAQGRVLIVGNHSGQLPTDGIMVGTALATNAQGPRFARAMIERFFPTVPYLGNLLNALGGVVGDPLNASKMLETEEAIIVFPEGVRGSGKLYKHRYKLQRFGNGFMHLALQHKTPIVPVGIVGCEETMPAIANIAPLARLLGIPYLPIAPPLPLPARVYLNFGKPVLYDCNIESEDEVTAKVEEVKAEIRRLIAMGLEERKTIF